MKNNDVSFFIHYINEIHCRDHVFDEYGAQASKNIYLHSLKDDGAWICNLINKIQLSKGFSLSNYFRDEKRVYCSEQEIRSIVFFINNCIVGDFFGDWSSIKCYSTPISDIAHNNLTLARKLVEFNDSIENLQLVAICLNNLGMHYRKIAYQMRNEMMRLTSDYAIKIQKNIVDAQMEEGISLLEEAVKIYEKIINKHPDHIEFDRALADILLHLGDTYTLFGVSGYKNTQSIMLAIKSFEKSTNILRKAVDSDPTAENIIALSECLASTGKYKWMHNFYCNDEKEKKKAIADGISLCKESISLLENAIAEGDRLPLRSQTNRNISVFSADPDFSLNLHYNLSRQYGAISALYTNPLADNQEEGKAYNQKTLCLLEKLRTMSPCYKYDNDFATALEYGTSFYTKKTDYNLIASYYFTAVKIRSFWMSQFIRIEDLERLLKDYLALGNIYWNVNNREKSLNNYEKALEIAIKLESPVDISNICDNIILILNSQIKDIEYEINSIRNHSSESNLKKIKANCMQNRKKYLNIKEENEAVIRQKKNTYYTSSATFVMDEKKPCTIKPIGKY